MPNSNVLHSKINNQKIIIKRQRMGENFCKLHVG